MKILLIQTNLAPQSKTAYLAGLLAMDLAERGADASILDLATTPLPFCDGGSCYKDSRVAEATARVAESDAAVWFSPIYNYDLNAVAKNFLELTSSAWEDKTVGFVVQAGGQRSFMSPLAFANSLMLDHRCQIVSRFVYVERAHFANNLLADDHDSRKRLRQLAATMVSKNANPIPAIS